jgi:hypothetical protein
LKTFQKIVIVSILLLLCINQNSIAQDSLSVVKPHRQHFKKEPLKATMMAIAFPGLGQIYNGKYWKIPVVYAGFGALVYSAGFNSRSYTTYMKAYQDFTDEIIQTDSYKKLILAEQSSYDKIVYPGSYDPTSYSYYKDGLLRMVDYFKRYRDLSYIGIAGWYLFSILDANVDASLNDFDVTDNLELTFSPILMPLPGGYSGAGLSARLTLTF